MALDVDVPSGSEDERFALSDDSDVDKDYIPQGDESESDDGPVDEEINEEIIPTIEEEVPVPEVVGNRNGKRQKTTRKTWQWSKKDLDYNQVPPNKLEAKDIGDTVTPLDFFLCMIGKENLNLISEESNRFLFQMKKDKVKPVTKEEVNKFIGILMYMSLVQLPQRRMYWSQQLRQENVATYMSCNRFEEILMILHLSDNELQPAAGSPQFDKLFKVRTFLSNLQNNFKNHAAPETHMCVDEQIIPFKGQHSMKVYMKSKPNKWGYKVWVLAGASGYIYDFQMSGDGSTSDISVPAEIGIMM